jgi:hypothetical protein
MKAASFFLSTIIFLTAWSSVYAIGIGLIVKDTANGTQSDRLTFLSSPIAFLFNRLAGMDLTLDTALTEDRLFNYRLGIDCDTLYSDSHNMFFNSAYYINRFTCTNTFGFGLIRSNLVRLWIGPQVSSSYEFRYHDKYVSDAALYNKFGAVAGINIHANRSITLSLETGIRSPINIAFTGSGLNAFANNKIEPILGFKIMFRSFDSFLHSGI